MAGRYSPPPKLTTFPNEGEDKYDGLLFLRAEFKALCSYHLVPPGTIDGVAYIGTLQNGRLLGLSKYTRLVQWHAARGIVEEELCKRIVDSISEITENEDVACHILAKHSCGGGGGVSVSAVTQTTVLKGKFIEDESVKSDFLRQVELAQTAQIAKPL